MTKGEFIQKMEVEGWSLTYLCYVEKQRELCEKEGLPPIPYEDVPPPPPFLRVK